MIKHVIFLKFFENADGDSKAKNLHKASQILKNLKEEISVLRTLSVGINQLESTRAFDMCLIAEFDDWKALDVYSNHPAHLKAVEYLNKVREVSHSCDYEF